MVAPLWVCFWRSSLIKNVLHLFLKPRIQSWHFFVMSRIFTDPLSFFYRTPISIFPLLRMKSVNRATLLGNVTRDPELKALATGQSVCTFGLATNRTWKDAKGAKQSLPEFHNLVAWGGLAEFIAKNVKKGKPLYVEGYLKTRSWEAATGAKMFRTEIVLENMVLLGPKQAEVSAEEQPEEMPEPVAAEVA